MFTYEQKFALKQAAIFHPTSINVSEPSHVAGGMKVDNWKARPK